ncbi:MAG: sugar transferase [Patescibacteria group bacterium]|nr:sugar transferase [Patescibacteria group bacterium]
MTKCHHLKFIIKNNFLIMRKSTLIFGVLRVPLDFLFTILAFIAAYELRRHGIFPFDFLGIHLGGGPLEPLISYLHLASIATAGLTIISALSGQYDLRLLFHPFRQFIRIITIVSAWMMLIIAYFFISRELFFSRAVLAYAWVLVILFIFLGRILLTCAEKTWNRFAKNRIKILFIGNNSIARQLATEMRKNLAYQVLGSLSVSGDDKDQARLNSLGTMDDLDLVCLRYHPDEIFQVATDLNKKQTGEIFSYCREHQIGFRFVPPILEIYSKNIDLETISGLPIVYLKPSSLDGWGRVAKRMFDIFGAIIGLIVFSPVMLITAMVVKLDSRGPVFFNRLDNGLPVKRVGKNKKLFSFWKFRSMKPKTDNLRYTELADRNMRHGTPLVKIKDDPRITRVGKFIRKTSIDELPNLFHVLTGQMSLVGPRPHLPEEVQKYKSYHNRVFAVKPGITGAAQISGRSDLDFDEEVRLDLSYIENWSLLLDIIIIIKTFLVIVSKRYEE